MIKAVIFDMDGVVADTRTLDYAADYVVLKSIGVVKTFEQYLKYTGIPARQIYTKVAAEEGKKVDVDKMLGKREIEIEKNATKKILKPSPGFDELAKELHKKGYKVALATSSLSSKVEKVLGVRNCFDLIITGSDVSNNKPAPDVYIEAVGRLGLSEEECIAVEDSPTGIASAKSAGLKCIALITPYIDEQDLNSADIKVKSLNEINASMIDNI